MTEHPFYARYLESHANLLELSGRLAAIADFYSADEPWTREYAQRWIGGLLAAASVGYFLHQASHLYPAERYTTPA